MIGFLSTPPCLTVQPRPGAGRSCSTCPSGAVSLHITTPLSTASEYREYRPAVQPSRAAQIRAGGSRSSGGTQSKKPLLERLLQQRKWGIAFLKCNTSHQVEVLEALINAGQYVLAEDYCACWNLAPSEYGITQAKIDAQLQHEAGKYLPFPLPQTAIILVQDSRSCQKAWERLQEAPLLGLDVEGCPQLTHTRRPVSLLQVATLDEVYLFDLLALKQHQDVLNNAASKVMQSAHVTKVGVELQNDLKKVYEGYPKLKAFSDVAAAVDIRDWASVLKLASHQWPWMAGTPASRIRNFGVSIMANCIFGKPVNKAYQTSDFTRRPLSAAQLLYAAMDAHVVARIHQHILDHAGAAELELFARKQARRVNSN